MTKKDFMEVVWTLVTLALMVSSGFIIGLYISSSQIKRQQAQIEELNQVIGEYRYNEAWFEDYVDVLEEIYEGKIENAVLEERIYWLEKDNTLDTDTNDYYLLEVVSRIRTRSGDAYIYTLRVYGSDETGTITSDQLFSVGEFVLGVKTRDNEVYLIDFDN